VLLTKDNTTKMLLQFGTFKDVNNCDLELLHQDVDIRFQNLSLMIQIWGSDGRKNAWDASREGGMNDPEHSSACALRIYATLYLYRVGNGNMTNVAFPTPVMDEDILRGSSKLRYADVVNVKGGIRFVLV